MNFNGGASSDPDNDALTYEWSFGDGSPNASGVTTTHTYTSVGNYTATLTVRDGRGGEDSDDDPDQRRQQPADGLDHVSRGRARSSASGEHFTLHGTATDPQDGATPDSALSWKVDRHHDTHTHPFLPPTPGQRRPDHRPGPGGPERDHDQLPRRSS